MKAGFLVGMLLATAVATPAQGRGSFGPSVGGAGHSGMNGGPGQGGGPRGGFHGQSHDHGFGHHHRSHDRRWAWGGWGYPDWSDWSDCGDDADSCDSGGYQRSSDDYGYADPPAPCDGGGPHPGDYEWSTAPCGPGLGEASSARHARASANACIGWVWRADRHHPVCTRRAFD